MTLARITCAAWALLGAGALWAAEGAGLPPITNCLAAVRLLPEEANRNYPVRLKARVTCYVPSSQLCFVQDGTGGAYVYPDRWPRDLAPGDVVEVEGTTGSGRFSSIVLSASIKNTGRKEPIEAKRVAIEELNTGRHDCQVIELDGVVQEMEVRGDNSVLVMRTGGAEARVLVFGEPPLSGDLVDARVRVRGVAGTYYRDEKLTGFGLFANGAEGVVVLKPPGLPFAAPARTLDRLHFFSPEGGADHRIRVAGTVTAAWPGEAFFIQEGNRAARVEPGKNAAPWPAPGDLVEASGFLGPLSGETAIQRAVFRKIGARPVTATRIHGEDLWSNAPPVLVAVEAVFAREERNGASAAWTVDCGGRFVTGYLPGRTAPPASGSQVRLTGVWSQAPASWGGRGAPGLWLAGSNAVEVLAPPPSATPKEAEFPMLAAIGAAAWALVSTGAAWRGARAAREKTRELQAARERAQESERELEQQQAARERLGRDLHDSAIQTIYAVGLNLDDCAQQVRTNPDRVESRLKSAMGDVNAVIRELRNVILGLETTAIQPKEFRTALKSLSLALGHEKSNRMRLDIEQQAVEQLSPTQATELVHIAREALSNSLRHGHAATTTFALRAVDERIRFAIEDDGQGFDPATAQNRGFGLRNMAKRAENLGAIFTVESQPGKGSRIVLDFPRQKQHFSAGEPDTRSHR